MKFTTLSISAAWILLVHSARAGEGAEPSIVARYEAPAGCPSPEAFAASARAELGGRTPPRDKLVRVTVTVSRTDEGYSALAVSTDARGAPLERTVRAPTCEETAEIAATIVALAQSDVRLLAAPAAVPPSAASQGAVAAPPLPAEVGDRPLVPLTYAFSLGYGAFTAGPEQPVIRLASEKITFNPAQGVRFAFEVAHAFGWWKQSLHISGAYYRQSTTTTTEPPGPVPANTGAIDISDRDVLHATIDACPIHVEYQFLSLLPCATFSMIQTRGESGNHPGLETGLGGSAHVRATVLNSYFFEALGAATARTSSYEPTSSNVRIFYALSLGLKLR
jgi:hypothetical protein